jgi:hypothetical protein
MKVRYVALARSLWAFDLNLLNPKGLSWQGVLEPITTKYKFAKAPKNLLDVNEQKNLAFQLGTFVNSQNTSISITLTIYNNGISAETQSSTDDATEFLKELTSWIAREHGLAVPTDIKKGYVSQVEVECDTPLVALNPRFAEFLRGIEQRVKTIDGKPRRFDFGAIQCFTEDVNQMWSPAIFRFERKWGSPFASNIYFTQSALETREHIEVLNQLEQLLKSQ